MSEQSKVGTVDEIVMQKVWLGNVLHDMEIGLNNAHGRIDMLEANYMDQKEAITTNKDALNRVERRLEKAEDQREKFNDYMALEVRDLKDTVSKLSASDDARHTELVGHLSTLSKSIDTLSEETAANSNYISENEAKERQERYAEDKVKEALAPRQAIITKIKMTAVVIITGAVLSVLGKLGWMAINIDDLVEQAKTVQVEKKDK